MTTTAKIPENGRPRTTPPPDQEISSPNRVKELEQELDRVKSDKSAERAQETRRVKRRRFWSTTLAVLAAVLLVASITGLWMRSTIMDSENFASTAAPLVKNDDVARAVSQYAAAEIVTHSNVEQEIQQVLPSDAAVLSGPIASALQDGLEATVQDVIQTDEFEAVFETAVKVAHEEALLVLEGDGDIIESKDGKVSINLLHVINDVLKAASTDLSALLGTNISIPQINPDDVPADTIAEFENTLGVTLPADFGQVTLFSSTELADAQRIVDRVDTFLEVIVFLTIAALIGAFALAADRRRTVITLGIAVPVVTIVTWLISDVAEADAYRHIDDPVGRAAARSAANVIYSGLDTIAWWTILLSAAAVAIAHFTKPNAGKAEATQADSTQPPTTVDLTSSENTVREQTVPEPTVPDTEPVPNTPGRAEAVSDAGPVRTSTTIPARQGVVTVPRKDVTS